jgi:hypothetical protein
MLWSFKWTAAMEAVLICAHKSRWIPAAAAFSEQNPFPATTWDDGYALFTHTGEAGVVAGKTVAAGTSLGAALMVWTGFSLALHRFRSWQKRRPLDRPKHTAQRVK